jgi:hypothetical protein
MVYWPNGLKAAAINVGARAQRWAKTIDIQSGRA